MSVSLSDVLDLVKDRVDAVATEAGRFVFPLLEVFQNEDEEDARRGTALLCLQQLFQSGVAMAKTAGWEPVGRGSTAGSRVWRHKDDPSTDVDTPPLTTPPGIEILLQLPLLYSPGEDGDGNLLWALKVVHSTTPPVVALEAALAALSPTASPPSSSATTSNITVVDVVQHDTTDNSAVVARQVWEGPWLGLSAEPAASLPMSSPPWRSDTWSAVTMEGVAALAAAVQPVSPPRLLFSGIGSCPVISFLTHSCPDFHLQAVFPSPAAVHVGAALLGSPLEGVPSTAPYTGPGSQTPPSFGSRKGTGNRRHKAVRRGTKAERYDGAGFGSRQCQITVGSSLDTALQASTEPLSAVMVHDVAQLTPATVAWLKSNPDPPVTAVCTTLAHVSSVVELFKSVYPPDTVAVLGELRLRDVDEPHEHLVVVGGMEVSPDAWTRASFPSSSMLVSLPVTEAQTRPVIRTKGYLSASEIEDVLSLGTSSEAGATGSETRSHETDAWKVRFLQTNGLMVDKLPAVLARLEALVRAVDREHHHLIKSPDEPLNVRCVELHRQVAPSPGLPDPKHFDADSLYTVDTMLSPDGAFEGGAFSTLEADGTVKEHDFHMGDSVVFVSHKFHSVAPVTAGTRQVLVVEFWRGPTRSCGHRCQQLAGPCPLDRGSAVGGRCGNGSGTGAGAGTDGDGMEQVSTVLAGLPFKLSSSETSSSGVCRLLWQENAAATEAAKPVEFVPQDAPVWDLFD